MDNSRYLTTEQHLETELAGFMQTVRQEETMLEVGQIYAAEQRDKHRRAFASAEAIGRVTRHLEAVQNPNLFDMRLEAVVPMEAFTHWMARSGDLGENPWLEEEFWNEFLRDNPECRVNTVRPVRIIVPDAGDDFNFTNRKETAAA